MVSRHFPAEIQRGIAILGLKTFDEVEEYLRNIDEAGPEVRMSSGGNNIQRRQQNFGRERRDTGEPPLQQLWMLAHDRMSKNARRRAIKHSGKITPIEFREGDKVLVRTHMQSCAEIRQLRNFSIYIPDLIGFSGRLGPIAIF
nr:unnamed protein product [Callosobruchus analis]